MKKRILITGISLVLVAAIVIGSLSFYKYHKQKNLVAEVQSVSMMSGGWYGDDMQLYGMVQPGATQEIYQQADNQVSKILIQEGQEVTVGTPILEYDTTQAQLDMERQELNMNSMAIEAQSLQKQIQKLQSTKPGQAVSLSSGDPETPVEGDDTSEDRSDEESSEESDSSGNEDSSDNSDSSGDDSSDVQDPEKPEEPEISVLESVDETSKDLFYDGEGTRKNPYIYLISEKAVMTWKHVQWLTGYDPEQDATDLEKTVNAFYENRKDGSKDGELIYGWLINGARWNPVKEETQWDLSVKLVQQEDHTLSVDTAEQELPGKVTMVINTAAYFTETPIYVYQGDTLLNSLTLDNGYTLFIVREGGHFEITSELRNTGASEPEEPQPEDPDLEDPGFFEDPGDDIWSDMPADVGGDYQTYTRAELNKMISEKKNELAGLEIDMQLAEIQYQQAEKKLDDLTVISSIDGVVETVRDPEDLASQEPIVVLKASSGFTLEGTLTELQLEEVGVGDAISLQSWMTGSTYSGTITSISDIPTTNYYGWNSGNTNVSYYPFTAYIEQGEGLTSGEEVQIFINGGETEATEAIFLEKAYVLEENGEKYVMKADENDRLVKQPVKTGRVMYGSVIEITEGLSMEDRIAFPYGESAKEGVKVQDAEDIYY